MKSVAAFLSPEHRELWPRVTNWAQHTLRSRSEPPSDDEARREARTLLAAIGRAGWLQALESQDLRSVCLVREAIAAASPLADAVVAIQGLGATALLLGGLYSLWSRR